MSIDSLKEYIRLFHEGDSTREARREILLHERARLVERMEEMQQALDYLDLKIRKYDDYIHDFEETRLEGKSGAAHDPCEIK